MKQLPIIFLAGSILLLNVSTLFGNAAKQEHWSYEDLRSAYADSPQQLEMIDLFEQKARASRRAQTFSGIFFFSALTGKGNRSREAIPLTLLLLGLASLLGFSGLRRSFRYRKSRLIEYLSGARPIPHWLQKRLSDGDPFEEELLERDQLPRT